MIWHDKVSSWICFFGVIFSSVLEIHNSAGHSWLMGALGWFFALLNIEASAEWRMLAYRFKDIAEIASAPPPNPIGARGAKA